MFRLHLCLTDFLFHANFHTGFVTQNISHIRTHTHEELSYTFSLSFSRCFDKMSCFFFSLSLCVTGNDRLCFWLVIFCSNRCHMEVVWKKRNTIAYRQRSQSLKKTSWQLSEERMTQREERRKGTRERENRDAVLVSGTLHIRLLKRRAIVKVL